MATAIGSFDLASLKNLRDDVTQYFWFESDSSSAWGSGAHVTLYPESQFTDSTSPNYMKGQNIIMNTDGFSIRDGGLPMMVLDNDSLDFNVVDTTLGTYTTLASFGLDGAFVQTKDDNNNIVEIAHLGYGQGKNSSGGISSAPYYTLGTRASTYIGNYSVAEGENTDARGYASHAEGSNTSARAYISHAEGVNTLAYGGGSHAEGINTQTGVRLAPGTEESGGAHAEGWGTVANGQASHSQNFYTKTNGNHQTAIGKYNDPTNAMALYIGNGTADNARSNALTVDWSGNVDIASGAKYKINGSNLSASDVGAVPTSRTVNNKALSSNISLTASDVSAVPTSRKVNGKALSADITLSASDVSALPSSTSILSTSPTLSSTGLSVTSSRCQITSGGIYSFGNWRFVQLQLTIKASLSANNTWGLLSGMPLPVTGHVCALAASAQKNYGNVSANVSTTGSLVVQTAGKALASGDVLMVTGWYIVAS